MEKQRRGERDISARGAELQKAIAINPRMGEADLKLGLLEEQEGKLAEAVAALQKAVEVTELPDEAHLRLGQGYRRVGGTEEGRGEPPLLRGAAERRHEQGEVFSSRPTPAR